MELYPLILKKAIIATREEDEAEEHADC